MKCIETLMILENKPQEKLMLLKNLLASNFYRSMVPEDLWNMVAVLVIILKNSMKDLGVRGVDISETAIKRTNIKFFAPSFYVADILDRTVRGF